VNIDRIVLTTFPGYFFTQVLSLRSIQQYAAGFPIDIIIDDFGLTHWPTYVEDCETYIRDNFPNMNITFHKFSDFPGMERVKTGGWFRQQLVKLYLDHFVTDSRWLVVDADVVFNEVPNLDIVSASVRTEPASVDIGNRLYVQSMLDCDQPWVVNEHEFWCVSGVPFRLIQKDLLQQLRNKVELVHNKNLFELHLELFEQNKLVAFDPLNRTMIMSEFQLIEVFRNRYYHTQLPIDRSAASNFDHSSLKDWKFERSWFEQQGVAVPNLYWNSSQTFGKHHV
jgi:hypothetical protein